MLTIETAGDLRWSDAAKTLLTGSVKFAEDAAPLPFTFIEAEWPDEWADLSARSDIAAFVPPPPVPVVLPAFVFFDRTSEAEADAIDAAMNAKPVKVRRLWQAANEFREGDALWSALAAVLLLLFGKARAAELLAPSS